jgi:PKD repeat protein
MWQALGHEANGIQGDPVFGGVATNDLTPLSGFGNNMGQNLNTIVPLDYNGVTRSATPDMGAIEYTPITDDIALISGSILRGNCLSTNDTVRFVIQNVIGGAVNFATDPVSIAWTINGPVSSSGTIVVNTGTLPLLGNLTVEAYMANLSQIGVYTLTAHLLPSNMNLAAGNDTLNPVQREVGPLFGVSPGSTNITNATATVNLSVQSPLISGSSIMITEICHWRGATNGVPVGGWPSYLIADDYVELTGVPNSDISGYIFESYSTTAILGSSNVLPQGTVFGPNGTLILAIGQLTSSQPSPSNFYYHTGGTTTMSSTTLTGHVLKDPQGNVIDAVGYGSYTFPAISGVTSAHWSGSTPSVSSAGNRLEGPDLNNGTGWVNSGSIPQTPNVVNPGVTVPTPQGVSGFSWTLNGVVVDTVPNITVGPWTQDGVYHYIATYNSPCGVLTDTVTITVVLPCDNPNNASYTSPTCGELFVSWNSVPNRVNSSLEYGPAGFTPGTGSMTLGASSPLHITGLTGNTNYDIYIVDTCANGFSNSTLLTATTLGTPVPVVSATFNQTSTGANSATVSFDASSSADYDLLSWDFGDGSTGTGPLVSHTYNANQTYTVTLTGTNNCGTTVQTYQVTVAGIGLAENEISRSLNLYPNPSSGKFSVSFSTSTSEDIEISIISATGQSVGQWSYASVKGKFKQDFDLSQYPAGIYMIQIKSNQGVVNQRIVLQK